MGNLQPVFAGVDKVGNTIIVIRDNIAENAALDPLAGTEFTQGDALTPLALFPRHGNNFLPLGKVGKLGQELRTADLLQEHRHIGLQKFLVSLIKVQLPDKLGQSLDRATHIDGTTHHADAGAVAEHRLELFGVVATDNGDTAAHELERKGTGILQDPQFGRLMGRVVLHQRTGTGTGTAADINLAAGRAVPGGVAAVPFQGQDCTGIEPANVCRGGSFHHDLRSSRDQRHRRVGRGL